MCALFIVELQLLEIQVNVLESLIDVLIVLLLFFFLHKTLNRLMLKSEKYCVRSRRQNGANVFQIKKNKK